MRLRNQRIPERKGRWNEALAEWKGSGLVAEASTDGNALAANGTATAQHCCTGFGLHARPKSVRLHTVAAVGLKCALGHGNALLFPGENVAFDSISEYIVRRVRNPERTSDALSIAKSRTVISFAVHSSKRRVESKQNGRMGRSSPCTLETFLRSFTSIGATQSQTRKVLLKSDCIEPQMCYYRDRSGKF